MSAKDSVNAAYELLNKIPVEGRSVKLMAIAMQHLENAFAELAKGEEGGKVE